MSLITLIADTRKAVADDAALADRSPCPAPSLELAWLATAARIPVPTAIVKLSYWYSSKTSIPARPGRVNLPNASLPDLVAGFRGPRRRAG